MKIAKLLSLIMIFLSIGSIQNSDHQCIFYPSYRSTYWLFEPCIANTCYMCIYREKGVYYKYGYAECFPKKHISEKECKYFGFQWLDSDKKIKF